MTQLELLNIANTTYGDEALQAHYSPKTGELKKRNPGGDTLARFIVIELIETFDATASDAVQAAEAHRVMFSATRQLFDLACRFNTLSRKTA